MTHPVSTQMRQDWAEFGLFAHTGQRAVLAERA